MSLPLQSISLSGPPGIGLFFQSEFLVNWTSRTPLISSIRDYDSSIPDLGKRDVIAQRWLGQAGSSAVSLLSNEEFVQALSRAAWNRHDAELKPALVPAFVEDGLFYESVCTARIAMASSISIGEANRELHRIMFSASLSFPRAIVRILLFWENFEMLDPNDPNGPGIFEALLCNSLFWQQANHQYTHVILRREGSQDHYRVHKLICERINEYLSGTLEMPPRKLLRPIWNASICVAFAGSYKSGKTALALALLDRATRCNLAATRVKATYLLDNARSRYQQVEDNANSPHWLAFGIIKELDWYLRFHTSVSLVFLESLARFDYAREMKNWTGGQFTHLLIVYVETSFPVRFERVLQTGRNYDSRKDAMDMQNGVHQIKDIADVVVNNDGDISNSLAELRYRVCSKLIEIGVISRGAAATFVQP